MFQDRSLLGRCIRDFVLLVLEYCSSVWCLTDYTRLKLLNRAVSGARFLTGGVRFNPMTLLIVDILHFCACCVKSGVTRCTRLMMLGLDRMCQCALHAVSWSHIGILMPRLAAESSSTAELLFSSQCLSGTNLGTP